MSAQNHLSSADTPVPLTFTLLCQSTLIYQAYPSDTQPPLRRFRKGGRGWQNPLKTGRTFGSGTDELRTPDQVSILSWEPFPSTSVDCLVCPPAGLTEVCLCSFGSRSSRSRRNTCNCNSARTRSQEAARGKKGRKSSAEGVSRYHMNL